MNTIYQEITLKNGSDVEMAASGYLKESEVRQATETFVVDTGAEMTVITEELYKRLGLRKRRDRPSSVAGGGVVPCIVAGPVEIYIKDRCYLGEVITMPGQTENLLGNSTMQLLDLSVNTVTGELYGNHGDQIVHFIR